MKRFRALSLCLGISLGITLAPASAHTQATRTAPSGATLPDSLTAAEFGALVARLSAPGGYFDTDNLISNESSYLHPLTILDQLGVRGGAYVGVGPDQNFSYMARVRPEVAFIVDIRRDNLLHHLLLKALFELSQNRAEYIARWLGKPMPTDIASWGSRDIERITAWADTSRVTTETANAAIRAVRERVVQFGIALSPGDLATIDRFHRTFIAQGLALRFTTAGRAPQPYYPMLGQLILERDLGGNRASYLVKEADFQFLKRLQHRNRVVPVVGDIAGPRH
jgi:hypothetical protein